MATVLHKTTKQLIRSAHTPNYSAADWFHNPDLSAVEGVPSKYWAPGTNPVREMTTEEKNACLLSCCKVSKYEEIDAKTDELIVAGFVFDNKTFSLSGSAQNRIMGTHQARNEPEFSYPLQWNTLDDSAVLSIGDAGTLHQFYLSALGTYRAHVDSGTALKGQVRDAQDIAAVDAIEDTR